MLEKLHYEIVTVNAENLLQHPQVICYINPKHKSYHVKIDWLKQRLKEGLVIKLLYVENEKRAQGYIEYVPGEYAWRAVSAKGYMFIHCIWIYSSAYKNKGIGTTLVNECIKDAQASGMKGVAVLTSNDAFMSKSTLFQKNGFTVTDSTKPGFELLVKQFKPAPLPRFNDWEAKLKTYRGLHLVYSNQCPWVARFVQDLDAFAKEKGLKITITELKTASEAQAAPSPYATFNLIRDGRLLADHYISLTRLSNILTKEKLI